MQKQGHKVALRVKQVSQS